MYVQYAEMVDLRNMVLWTIGFIANWYRIPPHQISLCPQLEADEMFAKSFWNESDSASTLVFGIRQINGSFFSFDEHGCLGIHYLGHSLTLKPGFIKSSNIFRYWTILCELALLPNLNTTYCTSV